MTSPARKKPTSTGPRRLMASWFLSVVATKARKNMKVKTTIAA
jgi:hypothetical protein